MEAQESKQTVRIHIDQHRHEVGSPATGEVLYGVGQVQPGLVLFREVEGDREDVEVPRGPEVLHLRVDEHFHSGKPKVYVVFVNGEQKELVSKEVTFAELVKLAFPVPPVGNNILYTVSYEDGPKANAQGSLKEGESVKVKDGMIFNVSATDKS
ncbi:MAG TPA: multiubiquitin domain-containing protein [Candidatus Saccharimonadales bacterium]|nr:multiubiquitin domain-containing protein [Candidatus Saccharimonadales bacterium]